MSFSENHHSNEINYVNFNQDFTCLALGRKNGFSIYNLDPIELRYKDESEGIGHIEMLYCSSLLALVGSGDQPGSSPRKFKLWNSQNKELICELTYQSSILSIHMNKIRLAVVLENQIHVYDLNTMECLQVLSTAPNPSGIAALSLESSSYLAFPTGNLGSLVLFDTISLRLLNQIDAHKSAIVALQFNREGTMLATASSTGTIIRVYTVPTGAHLCSFRRGTRPVHINSLSFSPDSSILACASSSGTVHIFSIDDNTPPNEQSSARRRLSSTDMSSSAAALTSSAFSWGLSMVGGMGVFPEPIQEYADSSRAVAIARIPDFNPTLGFRAGITATKTENTPDNEIIPLKIVAITQDKRLYRFSVPLDACSGGRRSEAAQCVLEDEALLE